MNPGRLSVLIILISNFYQLGTKRHSKRLMAVRVTVLLVSETVKAVKKLCGRKVVKIRPLLVFLTITCVINIGMCVFFAINATKNKVGASNYLLLMFMANMFVYLNYYIIMKYISNESLCLQAKLYIGKLYYHCVL